MSSALSEGVLVLEGTTLPASEVVGPLEVAERLRERTAPRVIVVSGDVHWHRGLVSQLEAHRRPAILAVGGEPDPRLFDEWVPTPPDGRELELRLRLARQRALERRRQTRRVSRDELTGLVNRRGFLRGLLSLAERARRGETRLALVLVRFDRGDEGRLRQVGQAMRGVLLPHELGARLAEAELAVLVRGDERAGARCARRVLDALAHLVPSPRVAVEVLGDEPRLRSFFERARAHLEAPAAVPRLHPSALNHRGHEPHVRTGSSSLARPRHTGGRSEQHRRSDRRSDVQ